MYTLNTCSLTQPEAEQFCRNAGGHLVSYESLEEQQEVEAYYIDKVSTSCLLTRVAHACVNQGVKCECFPCKHRHLRHH